MSNQVYSLITDRIINMLEAGTVPWHKPWNGSQQNLVSKKDYRGINPLLLSSMHFSSPYWLSYKQAQSLGGQVKKGEHGTPVVFWKMLNKSDSITDDKTGDTLINPKFIPMLRYYTVFNVDQCEGIPIEKIPKLEQIEFSPISQCEKIVSNMPKRPVIKHNEPRAYYSPMSDFVNMPKQTLFESNKEYYSTLFHELTHSTGHSSRLDRKGVTNLCRFGSTNYSKEELVAEMGACFLCGHTGIENKTINNSASYIKSWLSHLRNDNKLVIHAAAAAQKAADFILNKKFN